jgi:hypothetical protein
LATEQHDEPSLHEDVAFEHEDDFIDYLARRLCVESCEARARLSAWLATYEPPVRSGVRRAVPQQDEAQELERSA